LTLSEQEARALMVLFSYQGGPDGFLTTFYEKMGRHYLEPHEAGIRSLAKTLSEQLSPHLHTVDTARTAINEALKPRECYKCKAMGGRHYADCETLKPPKKVRPKKGT
jgi:hypothetical protein